MTREEKKVQIVGLKTSICIFLFMWKSQMLLLLLFLVIFAIIIIENKKRMEWLWRNEKVRWGHELLGNAGVRANFK